MVHGSLVRNVSREQVLFTYFSFPLIPCFIFFLLGFHAHTLCSKMTTSQETLMEEAFSLLQKNGTIPPESIPTALRAAGLNPSEEVIRDLQKQGGKGSQALDKDGYKKLVGEMDDQADTLESVLEAFRVFDKNLNGTVSTNEFRHIMTSMGEKYTDDEFRELVQGFDNGGVVEYAELAKKMLLPFLEHGNPADFIDKVK
eukprot:TRINITY_DN5523_c0_g1_i1.p2 TRINITY_DN5523_c0_g1~~TRINITY_DN5523_c0_g1_i1.p2  ORF type:complete len:199 (+),score=65.56 TRINITY_DN5523_c0_g1_i1:435-1031(+)